MTALPDDTTQWLNSFDGAVPDASNELFALLYDELHRIANKHMRNESPGHTLSATSLTHEAWFRLAEQTRARWESRSHFLAIASTMMRRILVNHAVARRADKRAAALVTLSEAMQVADPGASPELLQVHEALLAFEVVDPRAAKVVEMRFFGGLENDEIAQVLGVSIATVKRDWALARAWLHRALGDTAS